MTDPRRGVRERYEQGRQDAEIDASPAPADHRPRSTNKPISSWSENRSERDVLRAITPGMDSGEPDT